MQTKKSHELLVGLLFFGALALLVFFTTVLTGLNLGNQILTVRFDGVGGLQRGDNARVSGLQVGRVHEIELADDGRVEVKILLEKDVSLHPNYAIQVEDATLLGGKVVQIDRGDLQQDPIDTSGLLEGTANPGAVSSFSAILQDNRENLRLSILGIRNIVESVNEGRGTLGQLTTNPLVADKLGSLLTSLDTLSTQMLKGGGVIGGLAQDQETWENLKGTVANLYEVSASLKKGEGSLGKILQDDSLYADLKSTTQDLSVIVKQVKSGEGTVGRLIFEDGPYRDIAKAAGHIASLTRKLDEGDGTLAQLVNDPKIGQDLSAAIADLRGILEPVQTGEGTLGQLIKNPELYNQLLAAVESLGGAIEDARETAPINTFTSALFSIF